MTFEVTITGLDKLQRRLGDLGDDIEDVLADELEASARVNVETVIKDKLDRRGEFTSRPATGRVYDWKEALPGQTPTQFIPIGSNLIPAVSRSQLHRASAPGEWPKSDTGALQRSIKTSRSGNSVSVFARKEYADALEHGKGMAPRPFMSPTLREQAENLAADLMDRLRRETRGG